MNTDIAMSRLAVVAFDRISPFHLSVPCLVFENRGEGDLPPFDLRVCAAEPAPLRTRAGFDIATRHGLKSLDWADTVIVPSWRDGEERPPEALLKALRRAHERGAHIVGLCLGAYVLAEAGLLDGRRATTHWGWSEHFAARYPRVELQRDVLYVDDGRITTSAGTAAALDCCLHLLRRRHGAEIANRVARRLVVAPHRQGGQAQYIEQPLPASAQDDRLAAVLAWALAHLDQAHSLDALAQRALMSRRSFTRHFRDATGTTVGEWLAGQRLARAQRLLETSEHGLDAIAAQTGFGTAASLRQHFAARLGTSPSAYRRGFRGV
ncbi:Transcriptional regulator containing an amidase domain and an AraC-type DNA-binding HTH domain [Lysobacter capsici AZ78]|jgi:transcriptional regulator GlxA family with amidase domain|uniref:Transcriptional regulator containing an amidase domain and an AraC-type DNA-binding HTH domain n=1 Tax=Lysobacter capsici AZ78 TaxID=1444315 RepID=A0A108U825_9GAMM|nr:helix-turn-helix domain-containing protein [Lysobacter capsici]KWS04249.1 Transcriptional regulator containing an amidase domain and an AraC-type DNA-binding HTH domain [Lysobacter capsici AZ78]